MTLLLGGFTIPVTTAELLRVISTNLLKELYTPYFNFVILTSNGSQKTKDRVKFMDAEVPGNDRSRSERVNN